MFFVFLRCCISNVLGSLFVWCDTKPFFISYFHVIDFTKYYKIIHWKYKFAKIRLQNYVNIKFLLRFFCHIIFTKIERE